MSDGENSRDNEVRETSEDPSEDQSEPWRGWKIHRVPYNLKAARGNQASYVPQIVSLGPYHFGSSDLDLKAMESHKGRALQVMLHRTSKDMTHYLKELKDLEPKARGCYQGDPTVEQLDPESFVKMLLLDGVFMLEIIIGSHFGFDPKYYSADDPVFTQQGYALFPVIHEMIKLENQIPLFVLDKLLQLWIRYDVSAQVAQLGKPVAWYAVALCHWVTTKKLSYQEMESIRCSISEKNADILHCLDFFHRCLLHRFVDDHQQEDSSTFAGNQSQQAKSKLPKVCRYLKTYLLSCGGADLEQAGDKEEEESRLCSSRGYAYKCLQKLLRNNLVPEDDDDDDDVQANMIFCVTKLQESGVKFRRRKGHRQFWEIQFKSNGVLEIPRIRIDESLEHVLRNLIAFEQCHSHMISEKEAVVTAYTVFMDNLINTAEDVGHLLKVGIIVHHLGSDKEVAELFNSLCKGVYFNSGNGHYKDYFEDMNKYCHTRPNRWIAELKRSKFKNPWTIISLFAAVTLLVLTGGVQTAYAIASYNKQKC